MVLPTVDETKIDRTESDKQQFKPCLEDSIVLNREHLNKKSTPNGVLFLSVKELQIKFHVPRL